MGAIIDVSSSQYDRSHVKLHDLATANKLTLNGKNTVSTKALFDYFKDSHMQESLDGIGGNSGGQDQDKIENYRE